LTAAEIEREAEELIDASVKHGIRIYQPGRSRLPYYVAEGLNRMHMRRFIEEEGGRYRMNAAMADIVRYYANSIDLSPGGEGGEAKGVQQNAPH
jgi:hypothetical protein